MAAVPSGRHSRIGKKWTDWAGRKIPAIGPEDFGRICSIDKRAFGADRSFFLRRRVGFQDRSAASIRMVRGAVGEAPGLSPNLWAICSAAKG